jgi:hypothetical protein
MNNHAQNPEGRQYYLTFFQLEEGQQTRIIFSKF